VCRHIGMLRQQYVGAVGYRYNVVTNNGQTNICFAGVYRHKYLVLGRDKSLKCRKKSLIPAESSQKLKSSKCLCFQRV
jgi:hypothetical protein